MSESGRLRVGVAGVGHLGRQHARVVASLGQAELVGVYDKNPDVGRKVAEETDTRAFSSLREMISAADAVTVAVPTTAHFAVASECVSSGIHVLVEKPLTATVEEARALIELSERHSVIVQTGHVERFNPVVQASLSLIRQPLFIEGHRLSAFLGRSTDVDVILDLMIHDIDLVLATVHSDVRSVEATGVPILSSNVDIANARILFENGAVANLTASRVSKERLRKIRFFGRDSYISIDCLAGKAEVYRKGAPVRSENGAAGWEETEIAPGIVRRKITAGGEEPLRLEMECFVRCALTGEKPPVDGTAGLRAMEAALRVSEKIREGIEALSFQTEEPPVGDQPR
ncbi:MAG: Gfo/Idh/MocA family oxidoreductase [Candidatus Eiseniibacteriota bacterium]|nr:MAG: Gfo/Idh/MocA family oxidoreductase [Candidatus Eisenbacteria bacterium]